MSDPGVRHEHAGPTATSGAPDGQGHHDAMSASHGLWYFEFHDRRARLSGFLQMTVDTAAAEAVTSLCLWLPDGRTALASQPAPVTTAAAFVRTGGTRIRINDLDEDVDLSHEGRVRVVDDPAELERPVRPVEGAVAPLGPATDSETLLRFSYGSAPFAPDGVPVHAQLAVVEGTVRLGDYLWEIDARGLRGRARMPVRHGASHRVLAATIDDGFGFAAAQTTLGDGRVEVGGFVWSGTRLHRIHDMQLATTEDDHRRPQAVRAVLADADGLTWRLDGAVQRVVPVDSSAATRNVAGLALWSAEDGRTAPGTVHLVEGR